MRKLPSIFKRIKHFTTNMKQVILKKDGELTQLTFTCLKSTTGTLAKCVKYVQN